MSPNAVNGQDSCSRSFVKARLEQVPQADPGAEMPQQLHSCAVYHKALSPSSFFNSAFDLYPLVPQGSAVASVSEFSPSLH